MADYTDRQAALKALEEICYALWEIDIPSPTVPEYIEHHEQVQSVMKLAEKCGRELRDVPSADVTPVRHGRWIHDGFDTPHGVDWMHCSECGKRDKYCPAALTNYCPNCGARMRKGEEV